ncbi:hypothetical protein HQQ82_14385 [Rathayibacter sp. VKM Ac-2856]|uniref:hypothetical protein n=1 Tax=unclassified Rathayibacter TaxID=2609250 RepID=UPI001566FADD|nr:MULTISPECIES: hypothetical protein [unclassified Rathayibacter]NQX05885.1 hypothetical protein [Rathayibacter sp. VKM Ac-2858]NQX21165.1 hypothetical protein [Rathayibacter sp. VKM Ac-2856]
MTTQPENDSATTGTFRRRDGLAVAWTAPVLAAAVSAPGAAASTVPPEDPGPFVGLRILPRGALFSIEVSVGTIAESFTPVVLPVEARVDIVSEQDVEGWGQGVVVDSPRTGHILIPAGEYRSAVSVSLSGGRKFQVKQAVPTSTSSLSTSPTGTYRVTATVTRGPVYTGTEGDIIATLGATSQTVSITV